MTDPVSCHRSLLDLIAGSVCEVSTSEPVFHLTFDDGPHPQVTPRILDLLEELNAPATFFVLADHAGNYPELVRESLRRGHEIGLHGKTHFRLSDACWHLLNEEILQAKRDLEQIVGRRIEYFRPPYGEHGLRSFAVARAVGMKSVLWSVDSYDWKGIRTDAELRSNLSGIRPGGIGLLHDTLIGKSLADERTRGLISREEVARLVAESVRERGLSLVSVHRVMDSGRPVKRFKPIPKERRNKP